MLELGCGAGKDSAALAAAGYDVLPTDGSPELAAQAAKLLGRPVPILLFEDIAFEVEFDGVWANASLLHVPRAKLADTFGLVRRALKRGGVLYASFKAGSAEGVDGLGRYYNYPDETYLRTALDPDQWETIEVTARHGSAYDNRPTDWLYVIAVKA